MNRAALLSVVLLAGCQKGPERAVCGLHSAAKPVTLKGSPDKTLSVGARLFPSDVIRAEGAALLECFGGALKALDGDQVTVGELTEARIEGQSLPRFVLRGRKVEPVDSLPPSVALRYSDNRFTPASSLGPGTTTEAEYLRAFFTPNGIENLGSAPRADGPGNLPPPALRAKVARVHAGDLGAGGAILAVTDDFVFAETDELATAVLLEDQRYDLGRAVRLIIPKGAEAKLGLDGWPMDLPGPMDLRLR